MDSQLTKKAKAIIEKIIYITLAPSSKDGDPWNTPLVAAYDNNYNFYWRSGKDSMHSRNINANGKAFIVIYNTEPLQWGERDAVYIKATVTELSDENEINNVLPLIDKRSGKTFGKAENFLNDAPRRVYKAVIKKVWMNVDREVDGHFVDKRVEIKLSLR